MAAKKHKKSRNKRQRVAKPTSARGTPAAPRKSTAESTLRTSTITNPAEARPAGMRSKIARRVSLPNWFLLVPALVGMGITAILSYSSLWGESLPYCGVESACDFVQSSSWSVLWGVPVSIWGFLAYVCLAFIALRVKKASTHWQLAWPVAIGGVCFSFYLTAISIFVLDATCVYCLTSLGVLSFILLVLLGQAWLRPPEGVQRLRWTGGSLVLSILLLGVVHASYAGWFGSSEGVEDPYLLGLAQHLNTQDILFYGAEWCPVCKQQKILFGAAAKYLPYVECSPGGRNVARAPICVVTGIQAYPTWIVNGVRYVRLIEPQELAQLSNYEPPPTP